MPSSRALESLIGCLSTRRSRREPHTVCRRISRLRRKLQAHGDGQELIKTVYGAGYTLAVKVEWD